MTAITFPNSPVSGDTHTAGNGIVYTYDGEKWTSIGTNSAGTWSRSGTEVSLTNAGDDLNVDSGTLFVDASTDRVGIGTSSPNNLLSLAGNSPRLEITDTDTSARFLIDCESLNGSVNFRVDQGNILANSSAAFTIDGSERARIDSSGRFLVGTSTSIGTQIAGGNYTVIREQLAGTDGNGSTKLIAQYSAATSFAPTLALAKSASATLLGQTAVSDNVLLGRVTVAGSNGTNFSEAARIDFKSEALFTSSSSPGRIEFLTTSSGAFTPTERMRIRADGTSTMVASNGTFAVLVVSGNQSAGTGTNLITGKYSGTLGSANSGTSCFVVRSNGNVENTNNSYTGISDVKLKENIVNANPQWDDIKALQVRNYNFKEGQTHTQIGLIAQEVELVSPGLVSESPDRDEDGNDLGTVTKSVNYSVLYIKAVKALQEAMERIETLEAKVAALETP